MPIFIRTGQEMAQPSKLSPDRDDVFQRYDEQLQPHFTAQQKPASKEIVEKHSEQSKTL
jgi:hypothetical protein